jgi:thiamine pyrophosphate-dependent acetolactate synthase large subunit-like protein
MHRHELTDSEIQSPIDATTSPEPSSKKRKATYSARGVASLTPEQLAKKRANDREAQRAIRERTKAQIESLERRIQELTSQQPYQELQAALRQKDAIQAENDEIRRRLASVLSIIQPIIGAQGLTGKVHSERSTAAVSSDR